jgi:hypothetical protein
MIAAVTTQVSRCVFSRCAGTECGVLACEALARGASHCEHVGDGSETSSPHSGHVT